VNNFYSSLKMLTAVNHFYVNKQ